MANVNVTTSVTNVSLSETNNIITVTSTPSVINVSSQTANVTAFRQSLSATNVSGYGNLTYSNTTGVFSYVGVSNSDIIALIDDNPGNVRNAISVTDTGGDGSLTYSNITGVFTYTGPDQTEANARIDAAPANVRAHISNTAPIQYSATTGVISIDDSALFSGKTTDDLAEGNTNLYLNGSGTSDDLTEGATNLFFTTDNANTAIGNYQGTIDTAGNLTTSANVNGAGATFTGNIETTADVVTDRLHTANIDGSNTSLTLTGNASQPDSFLRLADGGAFGHTFEVWGGNIIRGVGNQTQEYGIALNKNGIFFNANDWTGGIEGGGFNVLKIEYNRIGVSKYIDSNSDINTTANVQGSWFVGNVDATTANVTELYVSGNIVGDIDANISGDLTVGGTVFATAFDGDGSDLTSVRAETVEEKVKNVSGGTLAKGTPVYATGVSTSDVQHVDACDASDPAKMPCVGVLATALNNDEEGRAIIAGKIAGVDTSTFVAGDQIFIAVGGGYANVAPTGEGNIIQFLGTVTLSDASGGGIVSIDAPRATPNLNEGNIFLGSSSDTAISVTPDTNFDTTGNTFSLSNALVDVNKIDSETDTAFTLYGEGGIELNQKVDSTESRIVDINTTGYSLADPTLPADFTAGTNVPSALVSMNITTGSNTATVNDIFNGALTQFGLDVAALRGPGFSFAFPGTGDLIITLNDPTAGPLGNGLANIQAAVTTTAIGAAGAPASGLANASAGLYGQDAGWIPFDFTTATYTTLFPANTYVTGMSGNVITFSEDALITATGRTVILQPGMAQTSSSNVLLKYFDNVGSGANAEFVGTYGRIAPFDQPETLSNTSFDAVSYGNTSTVTMTSVTMKNISDFEGSDESATRFKRGLLIGPSTTPDTASARSDLNNPSTLGVILESDGESFTGNNAPAPRFLVNNYSGALDNLTEYPTWARLGATGNLTLDLPQVKAPSFTLKSFRGAKSTGDTANYVLQAGDVVGKIEFRPGQTTGVGYQGVDYYNPPAAITVDVGDADIGPIANTYMHITTTPDPGTNIGYYRANASGVPNYTSGGTQQTNFTTKGGNVTIAAQTNGMITLAPTPDYGDASNSSVWTRYPGTTHEYHTFLNAGFADKTNRTGTLIELQPKSGTTTGSGGLGYDSVGNVTLRLSTHESNSDVKGFWDLEFDQSSQGLHLSKDGTEKVKFTADQTVYSSIPVVPSYSNTALPTSVAGGQIFVTNGNNKPAYGDGTNWYYYDDTQVT